MTDLERLGFRLSTAAASSSTTNRPEYLNYLMDIVHEYQRIYCQQADESDMPPGMLRGPRPHFAEDGRVSYPEVSLYPTLETQP
jgi:hypothetical protein